MGFLQIIEFKTKHFDKMLELDQRWREATEGKRTATSVTMTKDLDREDTYLWMIEFPSAEAAQQNDQLAETQQIAQDMLKVSEGEPTFRNLDLVAKRQL
jgi:hypothetical protein